MYGMQRLLVVGDVDGVIQTWAVAGFGACQVQRDSRV